MYPLKEMNSTCFNIWHSYENNNNVIEVYYTLAMWLDPGQYFTKYQMKNTLSKYNIFLYYEVESHKSF